MRRTGPKAIVRSRVAPVGAVTIALTMTLWSPVLAQAEPAPGAVAELVAELAEANQKLHDVGASVQARKQSVNKAIHEVKEAREAAAAAELEVQASERAVAHADKAIAAAQRRFDTFAAATYVQGPSDSYLLADNPRDVIATASASRVLAISARRVMADLQEARTEQVNKESAARAAAEAAQLAAAEAERSLDEAVAELTDAQEQFSSQQVEIDSLAAERDAARSRLDEVRAEWSTASRPAAAAPAAADPAAAAGPTDRWGNPELPSATPAPPFGHISQWDTTLPLIPSAFASGDPIAIVNAVLQMSARSAQVTRDLGRKFLQRLGILKPSDTGFNNGAIPRVFGSRATEYVIARAMKQRGVPYSWGGGNASGPTRGIDSGAGTVGFDCSGLMVHAFAGVGIELPKYSGAQYELGRKIPTSQARRGDVLFWGPGGSQHVALFLGNGKMIEAPYTGSVVKISDVRTSGMTPHAIRYIEG